MSNASPTATPSPNSVSNENLIVQSRKKNGKHKTKHKKNISIKLIFFDNIS